VVPNARLQFTWAWHSTPERESLVTIDIKPEAGGTLMIFNHAQFTDETARDNHARGWSEFFDRMEAVMAYLVIARSEATKQSRPSARWKIGLLRFARNDGKPEGASPCNSTRSSHA